MRRWLATLLIGAVIGLAAVVPAQAATSPHTTFAASCRGGVAAFLGFRSWDACLQLGPGGAPQITSLNDFWLIILVVVEDLMKAAGYVAVGFIIWGGIKYIKSQGDPSEIQQARQIIHNALFGLIIVVISVAIVTFVAGAF